MSQQGPGSDPSERIFIDLRSKNDEVKNKAAAELRDLITLLSRGQYGYSYVGYKLTPAQNGPQKDSVPSTTESPPALATSLSRHPTRATK